MHRLVIPSALLAVFAVLIGSPAASGQETPTNPGRYVAIGDSAAAGPLIWPQRFPQPVPCTRSLRNFPTLVAADIGATTFVDATCSGATVDNFFTNQADAPPQLNAVTAQTTLVTVGPIGGNDAGIVQAVAECLVPGCQARQGSRIHDKIDATRPEVRDALAAVKAKAPQAQVVVVGYGQYLPPGACPNVQPITRSDGDYVQGLVDHMNQVLASEAASAGLEFADLRQTPGALQHTACARIGQRWLEGLIPSGFDGAIAFHPTALGMAAFAGQVARTIEE